MKRKAKKFFYKPDQRPGMRIKHSTAKRLNALCNELMPHPDDIVEVNAAQPWEWTS